MQVLQLAFLVLFSLLLHLLLLLLLHPVLLLLLLLVLLLCVLLQITSASGSACPAPHSKARGCNDLDCGEDMKKNAGAEK